MNKFNEALKYQREISGYSQNALAKATGIAQPKISYYESGQHTPPIDFCITLAKFYGCTLDELLGLTDLSEQQKENNLPTQPQNKAIAFATEYAELVEDDNFQNITKLCNGITPELRAVVLGYLIGLLQSQGVNTQNILKY